MTEAHDRRRGVFGDIALGEAAAVVVGLGAFFSTLLAYSGATIAFVPVGNTGTFMETFAESLLAAAAVMSGVVAVAAFFGRRLPFRALSLGGGALYLATAAVFVFFVWAGLEGAAPVVALAIAVAAADVCLALAWGRICARFKIREALVVVALASVVSAGILLACALLPLAGLMATFLAASVVAVAVPAALSRTVHENEPGPRDMRERAGQVGGLLSSLLSVIAAPGLGLVVFAFVMAVMRGEFLASQVTYLAMLALSGAVLAAYGLAGRHLVSLHEGFYHTFLPLLALVLLAVTSVEATLGLGSTPASCLTYALYSFALVITLATLCAVANAGEFPADLVFSAALFLFTATSSIGQNIAGLLENDYVDVVVAVATAFYAFVMVLSTYFEHRRDRLWTREEAAPDQPAAPDVPAASATPAAPERIDPCERLAAEHHLTPRETEILSYLAQGHNGSYISNALFISPNTARTHIHNIYRKLGVSSREEILQLTKG